MAAGMVIAGSVLVVVTVGEQLATINSLETRRLVEEFHGRLVQIVAPHLAKAIEAALRTHTLSAVPSERARRLPEKTSGHVPRQPLVQACGRPATALA